MKKLLAIAVIAASAMLVSGGEEARAQGIHIGGRGVHIDVGRPHGRRYGGHSFYHSGYGHRGGWSGWGGHRSHYDWHDTSHYDFHPGGFERHRNHYHYVPPHYDYHRDGHWDRH